MKIYIVLTKTNTLLSKMISIIKNDEYTHASISLDKNLNNLYSFGRKNCYNPFVGRFVKENLNEGVFGWHECLNGLVMELNVTKQQYESAEKLLNEFILSSKIYKYNYAGLINSLFNRKSYQNDRFLCSEFVYYVLNKSKIADLNKPRNLVRPQDLLKLDCNIIFEGNLKNTKWSKRIKTGGDGSCWTIFDKIASKTI